MSAHSTLRWEQDGLVLLDQRLLPGAIQFYRCDSAASTAEAIRAMVVRGAPAIGCAAAYGVALEALRRAQQPPAEFRAGLEQGMEQLARSRPTAVNLAWALARMRSVLQRLGALPPPQLAEALVHEAQAIQ